jgi:hypothetical protein
LRLLLEPGPAAILYQIDIVETKTGLLQGAESV